MTVNIFSSPREHAQPSRRHRKSPFQSGLMWIWIGVLFPFLLASCTTAQPPDPISIVQAAYECLNQDDVDGYMELLSDDAVLVDRSGRYAGSQAIRRFVEYNYVPQQMRFELSNLSSDGNVVSFAINIYKDDYPIATYDDVVDVVEKGLIIFDGTEQDLLQECESDPSQAFCP
jgi:hypothetical protein